MNRQAVESRHIKSVGWAPRGGELVADIAELTLAQVSNLSGTLEVEFVDGHVYRYEGVPWVKFKAMLVAASKGGYFARYVKGQHSYKKVG